MILNTKDLYNKYKNIRIIKDCFAHEVNYYGDVISIIRLYANEIYPISGSYNYYKKPDEFWNTTHPEINVNDIGKFQLIPSTYNFTNEDVYFFEDFNDRYIHINGSIDNKESVASIIDMLIRLEVNPFITKTLKRKQNVI
jgi:hypothetical protein